MAKHGITITDQLFGTVASDITNLNQIVKTGQSLSYTMSNLDGTFRLRFPGYSSVYQLRAVVSDLESNESR